MASCAAMKEGVRVAGSSREIRWRPELLRRHRGTGRRRPCGSGQNPRGEATKAEGEWGRGATEGRRGILETPRRPRRSSSAAALAESRVAWPELMVAGGGGGGKIPSSPAPIQPGHGFGEALGGMGWSWRRGHGRRRRKAAARDGSVEADRRGRQRKRAVGFPREHFFF